MDDTARLMEQVRQECMADIRRWKNEVVPVVHAERLASVRVGAALV
jgi:hypothetical protein